MAYGIVGVLYVALQTALLSSVRYWLYRDNLRVPARLMYPILAVIAVFANVLWLLTGGLQGLSFECYRLILAVLMFLLSCIIIKEPFTKHALSYAFIMAYDVLLESNANYLRCVFSPDNDPLLYVAFAALVLLITFVPCVRGLKQMIDQLSALEDDHISGQLCMICFSFVFMNLLFTFPADGNITLLTLLSRYLMFLGMMGVFAAATRVMRTMQTVAEAKAQLALTQQRIDLQQSYYDRLLTQIDEVRRMRHDLRHHRAALAALIKSGDIAALTNYLDFADTLEESAPVSGNLIADSILFYFADEARTLHTKLETNLAIGRQTPVSDPDLCVILGNLLENALDAQKYLAPEKRFIRIMGQGDQDCLTLAVDNCFDGTLHKENGVIISRKEGEGHGVGLSSVRAVCAKYGGVLQLETDKELFMAGVVIGL